MIQIIIKGLLKEENFPLNQKNTHKVCNLYAQLYTKPSIKNKIKKKLSFGSKIKVIKKKSNFYKFDNLWIKKNDLKKNKLQNKGYFQKY